MTGVIWLVQVLVYPNFTHIPIEQFAKFHQFHANRITWIVAPVMGTELLTGIWIYIDQSDFVFLLNLISILALWTLTGLVSVPLHNRLEKNPRSSKNLIVLTNWPRTLLWTLRSLFWLWYFRPAGP